MGLAIRTGDLAAFLAVTGPAFGTSYPLSDFSDAALKLLMSGSARNVNGFVAYRKGMPVGRILVTSAQPDGTGIGAASFANFGCIDDPEVAKTLLDIAAGWARARGLIRISGTVGLIGAGLSRVGTGSHLTRLLALNGFADTRQLDSFWLDPRKAHRPAVSSAAQTILDDQSYGFAPQSNAARQQRLVEARVILSTAIWPGTVFAGMLDLIDHRRIDPTLCAVLHHKGQPVACCLGLPDLHQMMRIGQSGPSPALRDMLAQMGLTRPRFVVLGCAVLPGYRGLDIAPLLLRRVMGALRAGGYDAVLTDPAADLTGLDTTQTGVSLQYRYQLLERAV